MNKTIVKYTVTSAIADKLINEWFDSVKDGKFITISNNTQLAKLRLEHAKGTICIDHFDIEGEICTILDDGSLDNLPVGIFDTTYELIKEMNALYLQKKVDAKTRLTRQSQFPDFTSWQNHLKDTITTGVRVMVNIDDDKKPVNCTFAEFKGATFSVVTPSGGHYDVPARDIISIGDKDSM